MGWRFDLSESTEHAITPSHKVLWFSDMHMADLKLFRCPSSLSGEHRSIMGENLIGASSTQNSPLEYVALQAFNIKS
ncbi:hypothetical protein VNO77_19936 [Canavalia gladiata]|uniref:Uncharacterized protein n=1 Tax=Canavalia gladiata TaxID=3824 RepID=A0AAN9LRU2_CANGL